MASPEPARAANEQTDPAPSSLSGAEQQAAVATAIESLDSAERRLGVRIQAYGSASKALREELSEFAATLADAERKLDGSAAPMRGASDSKLRLVEDPPAEPLEPVSAPEEDVGGVTAAIGRGSRRERLMAEVAGALIGLGGTIALVRFVLIG